MIGRDTIIHALDDALTRWPPARAAWLGGSDANGRTDQWSDIDLQMIVEEATAEAAFGQIERALSRLSPIEVAWRLPQPTWHGHEQAFFQLRDADPCHMIDVVVMERNAPGDRFLEYERHGKPVVLFDHEGLLRAAPLDPGDLRERLQRNVAELRSRFRLFQPLVEKAIARGHAAEAVHFYHALTYRPMIELLRIRHCPARFDFGPRYLDRDLPGKLYEEVTRLAFAVDLTDLSANRSRCEAIFQRTLAEIGSAEA